MSNNYTQVIIISNTENLTEAFWEENIIAVEKHGENKFYKNKREVQINEF